jgi:hypothetical protein
VPAIGTLGVGEDVVSQRQFALPTHEGLRHTFSKHTRPLPQSKFTVHLPLHAAYTTFVGVGVLVTEEVGVKVTVSVPVGVSVGVAVMVGVLVMLPVGVEVTV